MVSFDSALPRPLTFGGEQLCIECFRAADLDTICAIEQRAHATPWKRAHFLDSVAHHVCFGLKLGREWIAYAIVSFVAGEAELLLFVVDKPWQGRGLGRRFLAEVLALCGTRASTLFLEVRASNERAVALYESLDFHQVGTRPNYYPAVRGGREDAWLFAIDLERTP